MLPETRNSHLAAKRERRKARKRLERLQHKQRKPESNVMKASNQPAQQMPSNVSALPLRPCRARRKGQPLEQADRDTIIGAMGRLGVDRVVTDICVLAKDRTRAACSTLLNALRRQPSYGFSGTSQALMTRLARHYQGGQQVSLPLPPQRPAAAAVPPSAPAPAQQLANREGSINTDVMNAIAVAVTTALGAVLGPILQAQNNNRPQLPPMQEPQIHGVKQFEEMPVEQQRKILNSMHSRYGAMLRTRGIIGGEHAAAWDVSYDAYDRECGANVKARSSAQSDSTGNRVKPLDLIEQDGRLVQFWAVCRKTWERAL